MDRHIECGAGRFVDRFAERRVRVDGGLNLFVSSFQRHRKDQLRNQLGGFRTDDVRTENLTVRLADDKLDEPFRLADRQCLPAG